MSQQNPNDGGNYIGGMMLTDPTQAYPNYGFQPGGALPYTPSSPYQTAGNAGMSPNTYSSSGMVRLPQTGVKQQTSNTGIPGQLGAPTAQDNANAPGQFQPTQQQAQWASNGGAANGPMPKDYSNYNNGLGMPSWLSDIYNKAGVKANDRGAGFTDWQYWADKPDQAQRLAADLAGTGTDTPGPMDSGAALGSGRGGGGSASGGASSGGGFDFGGLLGALLSNLMGGINNTPISNFSISSNIGTTPPMQTQYTPTSLMQSLL